MVGWVSCAHLPRERGPMNEPGSLGLQGGQRTRQPLDICFALCPGVGGRAQITLCARSAKLRRAVQTFLCGSPVSEGW